MRADVGRRDGFALATAIVALVVIGALVTGGFYAMGQGEPEVASPGEGDGALHAAESGIHAILGDWKPRYRELGEGQVRVDTVVVGLDASPTGRAVVEVHRLTDRLYFVRSTGVSLREGRAGDETRTLGLVVRALEAGDTRLERAVPLTERSWFDLSAHVEGAGE